MNQKQEKSKQDKQITPPRKKLSLKEYIDDNDKLLTAMGVMGGLAAFFTTVKDGQYLAFLSFAMLLVLDVELIIEFYKNKPWDSTLILFETFLEGFVGAIVRFMMVTFPSYFEEWLFPIIAFLLLVTLGFSVIRIVQRKRKK